MGKTPVIELEQVGGLDCMIINGIGCPNTFFSRKGPDGDGQLESIAAANFQDSSVIGALSPDDLLGAVRVTLLARLPGLPVYATLALHRAGRSEPQQHDWLAVGSVFPNLTDGPASRGPGVPMKWNRPYDFATFARKVAELATPPAWLEIQTDFNPHMPSLMIRTARARSVKGPLSEYLDAVVEELTAQCRKAEAELGGEGFEMRNDQ